jgi:hypothetical protein
MACEDFNEFRCHLGCTLELDEYDDGTFTVECATCGRILFTIDRLILPSKFKTRKGANDGKRSKDYRIS